MPLPEHNHLRISIRPMASTAQAKPQAPTRASERIAKQAKQRREGSPNANGIGLEAEPRKPDGPNDSFSDADTACKRFMRALYVEIHDSTIVDMGEEKRTQIQDLIRRTRSRMFLNSKSAHQRARYDDFVQNGFRDMKTVPARQEILDRAMLHFRVDNTDSEFLDKHLAQLVNACGYATLAICLHSSTFLEYVRSGVDRYELDVDAVHGTEDEKEKPKLGWQPRFDEICAAKDSLELFAKLRRLDYQSFIWHYEGEFRILLSTAFRAFNEPQEHGKYGLENTVGIGEIHDVVPWQIDGKHWALPVTRGIPAEVCTINYRASRRLVQEFPDFTIGQQITEVQEDIPDSIILDAYTWPGQQTWPSDDPREDGYATPCWNCDIIRGPVPRKRGKTDKRPCKCTLVDKQRTINMPTDPSGAIRDALYELITTEKLGRGVRALQNFQTNDILGLYHGEIYPRSKLTEDEAQTTDDDPSFVQNRYGGPGLGSCYIFDAHMPKGRHAKVNRRKNSEHDDSNKAGQKPKRQKKKNSSDDDTPKKPQPFEPLDPDEWKRFRVDSAVKGNWTRYVNHSCDPNVHFYGNVVLAGKQYIAVAARRDITFGDHICIHYGKSSHPSRLLVCSITDDL